MKKLATLVAAASLALSAAAFAKPDPGAPLLGSFIEDFAYSRSRLGQHPLAAELAVVCELEPCTQRRDLDGDGRRDIVFQVVRTTGSAVGTLGLAIALTGGGLHVHGAGLTADGVDGAVLGAPSLPRPWGTLPSSGLVAPPHPFSAGIIVADVVLYWSNDHFEVVGGMQRSN